MNLTLLFSVSVLPLVFPSCQTATDGAATTATNAVKGVGRTVVTAGTGVASTVGQTVKTAGTGIANGDVGQATGGAAAAAVHGTANTAVRTGQSHMKTTSGVIKDTGTTIEKTSNAATH